MPFRYLPDVALADIAYEASASTMDGLFEAAGNALTEVMVDRRTVRLRVKQTITVTSEDADRLLYDFLTELIYRKDVDSMLFKKLDVKVSKDGRSLTCAAEGEKISRKTQKLRNDAKAVTMHMFGIRREGKKLKATVVLDI